MTHKFSGKSAVITGGSRGIGLSIAKDLATKGAQVALLDIDEDALKKAKQQFDQRNIEVFTEVVNVTNATEVEQALQKVNDHYKSIDIVVNNAGIIRDNLLFKMSDDDWQTVLNVHLNGAFNVSRAAQKYMVKQQYGRIINISSTSALGNRGQANYATAKAGIQGLTKTLAIELGQFGITVNAVAPGFIKTDMTRQTAERLGVPFDTFLNEMADTVPAKRVGQPEDIAHVVAFLAEERSSYVNGQVIYVAGGPKD